MLSHRNPLGYRTLLTRKQANEIFRLTENFVSIAFEYFRKNTTRISVHPCDTLKLDMKIFIKAKPSSKINGIEQIDECHFIVSVKEPPVQGRANVAIIEILADYFKTNKGQIKMLSGLRSKEKTFLIQ